MDSDSRIALRFGGVQDAGARTALLIEDGAAASPPLGTPVAHFALSATAHIIGCACCLPRGPVSMALGRLFLARARGETPLFDTVVAVMRGPAGEAAVRAAVRDDLVTRARFRLVDQI
jgi:hypothetical protein